MVGWSLAEMLWIKLNVPGMHDQHKVWILSAIDLVLSLQLRASGRNMHCICIVSPSVRVQVKIISSLFGSCRRTETESR